MSILTRTTIVIPRMSGQTGDLASFFEKKIVKGKAEDVDITLTIKIDRDFKEFMEKLGPEYTVTEVLHCSVFQTMFVGRNADDEIINLLNTQDTLDANRACAILEYLGIEQALITIPEGHKKVSIILGYAVVNDERLVFYLERELIEEKAEEIHLYARPLNLWGDHTPMIILTN